MKIAFYDTKEYDTEYFDTEAKRCGFEIIYFESKLDIYTAVLAEGCEAVCIFVNDRIDKNIAEKLIKAGVKIILLRCAGYDNVDLKACAGNLTVMRVPSYSPEAVAEYASALLLTINRQIHRAYTRSREFNFKINGLTGFTLMGKTAGVIGTGKIGRIMAQILKGYKMNVLAYDIKPDNRIDVEYTDMDTLLEKSDIISIHCPLTKESHHMINKESIAKMKTGAVLINTSRGALIDTGALTEAIDGGKFRGVALDVYEEEEKYFYEDKSQEIIKDTDLIKLMSYPNVLVTSHQAFFTDESLCAIAETTCANLKRFEKGEELENIVCEKGMRN